MLDISEALSAIVNGLDETVKNAGFSLYYPEGADKRSLPFVDEDKRKYICYDGDGCSLKIEFSGRTVSLFYADSATSDAAGNSDYASLSTSLLEAETSDEKDVKYITEEFIETIENKFAGGKKPKAAKKNIQTVSKTAVKNGAY
nr:hypothetical protein [Clostridiales bacterium]